MTNEDVALEAWSKWAKPLMDSGQPPPTLQEGFIAGWKSRGEEIETLKAELAAERPGIEVVYEPSPSEAASFHKTLARSPRIIRDEPSQPTEPPYRVRSFWSPERKHLITVCCSQDDLTVLDDNANTWEPTGPEQDMTKCTCKPLQTNIPHLRGWKSTNAECVIHGKSRT